MERKPDNFLNSEFKTALFRWHSNPEHPFAAKRINDLIDWTAQNGVNFTFKVTAEILKDSEGSRAMLSNELMALAKREGDQLVFNFRPRKDGVYKMKVVGEYLILADKKHGTMVPGAFFRAHEVTSLETK